MHRGSGAWYARSSLDHPHIKVVHRGSGAWYGSLLSRAAVERTVQIQRLVLGTEVGGPRRGLNLARDQLANERGSR